MFQWAAMSLVTKVSIVLGSMLLSMITSAYLTWQYTRADLEVYIAKGHVAVMKQIVEVKTLDAESLKKALQKQQEQFLKDRANDTEFATIIKTDPVFIKSECTLNADSLRLWNSENRGAED